MSTEVQKPVAPVEEVAAPVASVADPTPAAAPVESETKPVEAAVEPKAEETSKAEETPKVDSETTAAAVPVEEKKEEKPVEPIYSGALGYKAPGLKNIFRTSKKYFWFGEEAAVPASSLSQYLRGEKAEVAHPTVAWSSVTGKGLLFFVKHADQKETPAGVLNLADATELSKDGPNAFHFKLHGDKHSFEASSTAERNGWFIAVEKAITEAKASKEGIVTSEAYLEEKKKLDKPTLAPAAAAATTPKKSTEAPKPVEGEAAVAPAAAATTGEDAAAPVRAGSSSSDEEKKKKASKSKSRSASRGKRASLFGSILGKKEKAEEKAEEKKEEKEEKKEEKAEEKEAKKEEATPVVDASVAPVAAPVVTDEVPAVEETKAEEATAPVAEEKKVEEKPKPTKRASIFGSFVEKLKSPTHEKKEPELTPIAKEPEVAAEAPKVDETPKIEEPAAAPAVDAATEAPKKSEDVKPATTPAKEKQHFSFGKFLGGGKDKVKTPTTEKAPELPKTEEAPAVEETPAPVAPVEPVEPAVPAVAAEEPTTEVAKEEPATEAATAPAQKKRGSIFGLGGSVKKEKDGEEKPQGLKGLFRNASKAGKTPKKEKETTTPAKVEEAVEPTEEKTEEKTETPAAPASTEQAAIGDVVPDAVTVGQAPKSTPAVTSSA